MIINRTQRHGVTEFFNEGNYSLCLCVSAFKVIKI